MIANATSPLNSLSAANVPRVTPLSQMLLSVNTARNMNQMHWEGSGYDDIGKDRGDHGGR
jgi:hypothetical protein